jgi:hypothetical protein
MTGYRRYLLYGLYGALVLGAVLLFAGPRTAGTFPVVAAVLGVVAVSVTGRENDERRTARCCQPIAVR